MGDNTTANDVTRLSRFLTSFVDGSNLLSWSIATLFRIYLLAYHVDLVAGVLKLHDFTSRLDHLSDLRDKGRELLKFHASALVKSHVDLANDIKSLNKCINGLAVGYMNVMALQICMYLFCLLEFDDIVTRLKYAFCILFVIMVMSVCTSFGQRIINAGDILSWELYNCPWLEMPNWFKRSLLLMMTRSMRKMELKPYGLYVLDLRCLTSIVNATYSYFNFFLKV
ncbi:odorant receptor 43a-like isoform X2 [Nilaparvata lugens]|uniref:odorant receptor 43a-like isoform X2 n=1 Tax=Nilaparvata lugens TaxID=108931 RepID=UPI00193DECC6|nr:odorant receptor 43a-like isoform X2 [Nilaparvata lugens]